MNVTLLLLNVIFCIVSLVQFVVITKDAITSTSLYTETSIVPLASQQSPLRVSVCVNPGQNNSVINQAGYFTYQKYQEGQSRFNQSLYGWAGHTEDGQKRYHNASILQKKFSLWGKLSDVVFRVGFLENDDWIMFEDKESINSLVEMSRHYYTQLCFTLRHNNSLYSGIYVILQKNLTEKLKEAEIRFDDVNLFSGRQIGQFDMKNLGPRKMTIYDRNCSKCVMKMYQTEISQTVYTEKDLTKNCVIYPTKHYKDYKSCDQKFGLSMLSNAFGQNMTPPWATDDVKDVTSTPSFLVNKPTLPANLAAGIKLSDCKIPCTTTKTNTIYQGKQELSYNGLSVLFNADMQVTSTSLVPFSFSKFLSDIGGILGLWLGLGMVQLGELLLPGVSVHCEDCGSKRNN